MKVRNSIFTFVIGFVIGILAYYLINSRLGSTGDRLSQDTIDSLKEINDSLIALNIRSIAKIMRSNERLDSLKHDYDSIIKHPRTVFKTRYRTIYRTDTITVNSIFDFFTGESADTSQGGGHAEPN